MHVPIEQLMQLRQFALKIPTEFGMPIVTWIGDIERRAAAAEQAASATAEQAAATKTRKRRPRTGDAPAAGIDG